MESQHVRFASLEGQTLPSQLDLGVWGTFYLRPFSPEPTRCYRCHAFGHTIYRCRQAKKYGICSAPHDTSICLEKYKRKEQITSCCPNCGKAIRRETPNAKRGGDSLQGIQGQAAVKKKSEVTRNLLMGRSLKLPPAQLLPNILEDFPSPTCSQDPGNEKINPRHTPKPLFNPLRGKTQSSPP
ncbi:hypothetical protein GWK47_005757 [Chionoecetes opilio]|uniref:Uncharacterized protein n=1 Tax=Chionoecetes opilio TaxID=41210 RepID=A0A8J5CW50_CHIOP|nr:hypothetical protein GWK47_005757 [Chionoecetes opilio]